MVRWPELIGTRRHAGVAAVRKFALPSARRQGEPKAPALGIAFEQAVAGGNETT
jgi:hypothetical protein